MRYTNLLESLENDLSVIFEAFTPNINKGKKEVLVVPGRYSVPHLGHFELFTKSMELFGKNVDELVIANTNPKHITIFSQELLSWINKFMIKMENE